jgi:type II secretory pathway component PulJ
MMRAPGRRAGLTLVEILVSLMIFSVVSLAMFGILLASTNIFRSGEFGRASTDEAVSALSILDEDVRRMVPGRDNGLFYSILHDPVTGAQPAFPVSGDCATAFMIYQTNVGLIQGQNASQTAQQSLQHGGGGERQLVIYYVECPSVQNDPGQSDILPQNEETLWRLQVPLLEDIPQSQFPTAASLLPYPQPTTDVEFIEQLLSPALRQAWLIALRQAWQLAGVTDKSLSAPSAVAKRVLYFGTWISNEQQQRAAAGDWLVDSTAPSAMSIPPCNVTTASNAITTAYSTQADPTVATTMPASPTSAAAVAASSFPAAVLFTLSLSVGRYAPQGTVVSDLGGSPDQIRVANLGALPLTPGSKVRIGTEWVEYSGYSSGVLTVMPANQDPLLPLGGRGALRSTQQATITRSMPVQWGPMYSMARTFPH